MKYVVVIHSWFVISNGFELIYLDSTIKRKEDAHAIAKEIINKKTTNVNKCEYALIEFENEVVLNKEFNHKLNKIPKFIRKIFNAD